ncbi:MAG: TonB-dependent receptor [Myxococcota bacterium]
MTSLLMVLCTLSQPAPTTPVEDYGLGTIVRSSRRDEKIKDVPFAVTVLEEEQIADGRPSVSLGEALNQVPGLLATSQFNATQDLRLSVRGFGARATFGVRGVRVFLDGVPLTVPDGSSALDVIDPALISRIEVLRGPAAALYGSAASAVILIETARRSDAAPVTLRTSAGQNGLLRGSATAHGETDSADWLLAGSSLQWNGERERSAFRSATALSRVRFDLSSRSELALTVLGHNGPLAQDPGAVTAEAAATDPTAARDANVTRRAGEQVRQGQLGLAYRYDGDTLYVRAQGHGWARQFRSRLPLDRAVELDRWIGGARVIAGLDFDWLRLETGFETDVQRDRRTNFGNDAGVVTDDARLRQDENLNTAAWVGQLEIVSADRRLRGRLAGRFDRYTYSLRDRLLDDGDGSGERRFSVGTGLAGIVWRPVERIDLFANYSLAYDVPTLGELAESTGAGANPTSGLDDALNESLIQSAEIGVRGQSGPVRFETTVFVARSSDEIISVEVAPDVDAFRNAGRSDRAGAEALVAAAWHGFDATLQGSALFSDVRETGRGIPGAPEWLGYGQLRYRARNGLFAAYELRHQGEIELGGEESERAWISSARIGRELVDPFFGKATVTVGVQNLTNEKYSDNLRPNSFGGRFFEPAPSRWFYLNLAFEIGGVS